MAWGWTSATSAASAATKDYVYLNDAKLAPGVAYEETRIAAMMIALADDPSLQLRRSAQTAQICAGPAPQRENRRP